MRRAVPLLAATILWALSCHGNQSPSLHEASDNSEDAALPEWESTGALGQEHFREGNFPEAIRKFRLALAASPPHRQAYYLEWLAATLLAAHEYERVLEVAAEIDALEPASGAATLPRLKAYEALGRDAEGLALATRARQAGHRALRSGSTVLDATEVRRGGARRE
jgi:tetratricopeptide (TPR) repeat protein